MTAGTDELLDLAIRVALEAGAVLTDRWGNAGAVTYKTSDTDPVSEADQAAERSIISALSLQRPDDGLLGEEGADRQGTSGLRWVVDPLDGTVNYLYGMPAWSVSIACEDGDGALVGVVHQPTTGTIYTAVRGQGAFRGKDRLNVNEPVPLSRALVATGFAYDVENRTRQAETVARVLPLVRDIRRVGSAALDLCMVADGLVDGYFEAVTHRWDWSAGALIATEAGATVRQRDRGIVAAGPTLFPELYAASEPAV